VQILNYRGNICLEAKTGLNISLNQSEKYMWNGTTVVLVRFSSGDAIVFRAAEWADSLKAALADRIEKAKRILNGRFILVPGRDCYECPMKSCRFNKRSDLRYGRTVHSLAYALSLYKVRLFLVSPDPLRMRKEVLEDVRGRVEVYEYTNIEDALPEVDVLYLTRIQKERFSDLAEYAKVKGSYRIDLNVLKRAKSDLIILHPLPRVDEISVEVDSTPFARYFQQVENGLVTRMALMLIILGAIKE